MADISIHPDAEAEYEAALAWYMARSERAAAGFETAFEQALKKIAANPELYPLRDDRHRFCLLRRYPYSLIYRVEVGHIQVVAVAHALRLPGYWSGRI
jgi:toxin ParE1/3/4